MMDLCDHPGADIVDLLLLRTLRMVFFPGLTILKIPYSNSSVHVRTKIRTKDSFTFSSFPKMGNWMGKTDTFSFLYILSLIFSLIRRLFNFKYIINYLVFTNVS